MHINRNTGSFQNCNQFLTTLFPPFPTTEKVAHNITSMLYYISISILVVGKIKSIEETQNSKTHYFWGKNYYIQEEETEMVEMGD